jgi:hypothetical protein
MNSLIRVELKDGTICRMAIKAFNLFLSQDKIMRFERSDGWVIVGKDPLRCPVNNKSYSGPERREFIAI